MSVGKNDFRTGYYVSSEEIKSRLDIMKELDVQAKEPEYNIIIVQTPNGNLTIKTKLTKEQWLQNYKKKSKKKDLKTFKEGKDDI